MTRHYQRALDPSDLGGSTVKLKFTSIDEAPRHLEFRVADGPLGKGAEALAFTVTPLGRWTAVDYRALGFSPDTSLVARFSTRATAISARRTPALRSIIKIQRSSPDSMIGLVPIFGFGVVDRVDGRPVQDVIIYFDLLVFAGAPLTEMVVVLGDGGPGKRWTLTPGETAAALIPAAKALAALHGITETVDGRSVATAHRDIKPGNLLVLWQGGAAYRKAVAGFSPQALPGYDLPLVRVGDLGEVRSVGTGINSTATETLPNSGRWTAPEAFSGLVPDPAAADVWSYGATLFFAATGSYPWTKLDFNIEFDPVRFQIVAGGKTPDSPAFEALPASLADLVRRCLAVSPSARPTMAVVAMEQESLVGAERVFEEADTPTQEILVDQVLDGYTPRPPRNPAPSFRKFWIRGFVLSLVAAAALGLWTIYLSFGLPGQQPPAIDAPESIAPSTKPLLTPSSSSTPSATPSVQPGRDMLNQLTGPPRQRYTTANPPEVPQLNSILDRWMDGSSGRGNEADLTFIGRPGQTSTDSTSAHAGEELVVSAYVFNDANHATGVFASLSIRIETVENATEIPLRVIWTSPETGDVFSTVTVRTDVPATLKYVPGSMVVKKDPSGSSPRPPVEGSFGTGGRAFVGFLRPTGGLDQASPLQIDFKVIVSAAT